MSLSGDASFLSLVRRDLDEEIDRRTDALIANSQEAEAGYIRGLIAARALIDSTFREMTAAPSPEKQRGAA